MLLRSELEPKTKDSLADRIRWVAFAVIAMLVPIAMVSVIVVIIDHTRNDDRRAQELRSMKAATSRVSQLPDPLFDTTGAVKAVDVVVEIGPDNNFCAMRCEGTTSCELDEIRDDVNHVLLVLPCVDGKVGTWLVSRLPGASSFATSGVIRDIEPPHEEVNEVVREPPHEDLLMINMGDAPKQVWLDEHTGGTHR